MDHTLARVMNRFENPCPIDYNGSMDKLPGLIEVFRAYPEVKLVYLFDFKKILSAIILRRW